MPVYAIIRASLTAARRVSQVGACNCDLRQPYSDVVNSTTMLALNPPTQTHSSDKLLPLISSDKTQQDAAIDDSRAEPA